MRLQTVEKSYSEADAPAQLDLSQLTDISDIKALRAAYASCLEKAAADSADTLDLPTIQFGEVLSGNFQNITMVMRVIMNHLKENEYPKNIRFFSDDPEATELYRVVYNYWYAPTEEEKMFGPAGSHHSH